MVYEVSRKHFWSPATGLALSNADAQLFLKSTYNQVLFSVTFPPFFNSLEPVTCCLVFLLIADQGVLLLLAGL